MIRLAWIELEHILSAKIKNNDTLHLLPLLKNIRSLNESYETKDYLYEADSECFFEKMDDLVYELEELIKHRAPKEQIISKTIVLTEAITHINAINIRPIFKDQLWIMDRMRAVGYKITDNGECYGLAYMATQAFLIDDMASFNQRLQLIYQLSLDDCANDFKALRQKKQYHLEHQEHDKAKDLNEMITDLRAFFDGIALYQLPQIYLHDEQQQPLSKKQDAVKTRAIVQSIGLEKELNVPADIAILTGTYTKKDLAQYLDLFVEKMGQYSFALNLGSNKHAMALFFDAKTQHWIIVDPNNLPPEDYIHTQYVVAALFNYFCVSSKEKDLIVMSTRITTIKRDEQPLKQQYEQLQNDERWKKLHCQRRDFVDVFGFTAETLYELATCRNSKIDDADILNLAFSVKQYDVIVDYVKTHGVDIFVNKSDAYLSRILFIFPQHQKQKLLSQLSLKKKAAVISHYVPEPIITLLDLLQTQEEKLAVFEQFSAEKKAHFLVELTDLSMHKTRDYFLNRMSMKQKIKAITYCKDKNAIFHDTVSQTFFQLLPWNEQLNLFFSLNAYEQAYLLRKLQVIGATALQDLLWQKLNVKQKSKVVREDSYILEHLRMIPEEELQRLFWNGEPYLQAYLLEQLVNLERSACAYRFLKQCSEEHKIGLIKQECCSNIKNPKTMLLCFHCLPEPIRVKLLDEEYAPGRGTIGAYLSHQSHLSGFFDVFLCELSVDAQFNFIKKWPLNKLAMSKKIMQAKTRQAQLPQVSLNKIIQKITTAPHQQALNDCVVELDTLLTKYTAVYSSATKANDPLLFSKKRKARSEDFLSAPSQARGRARTPVALDAALRFYSPKNTSAMQQAKAEMLFEHGINLEDEGASDSFHPPVMRFSWTVRN